MRRVPPLAVLLLLAGAAVAVAVATDGAAQDLAVLHIRVVLPDVHQQPLPVPRHVLLISDNPASTAPRRVITKADGTADVRLRPGNYTVESEGPTTFLGQVYQWTQTFDVRAGPDTTLELTAANAERLTASAAPAAPAAVGSGGVDIVRSDPSLILPQWQASVVEVWTPSAHATGFVVDAAGLIATNQRVVGTATSVAVQLGPAQKVAGVVVTADATRGVAVVRVDPAVLAGRRPVPLALACAAAPGATPAAVRRDQGIVALEWPMGGRAGMAEGEVVRVDARALTIDAHVDESGSGGPVFTADGALVGLTAAPDDDRRSREARVIRISELCPVVIAAQAALAGPAPDGALLPVEPTSAFPNGALEAAASRRAGSLNPYALTAADFTVSFITPVMMQGARQAPRTPPPLDFGTWSGYFADVPPVLVVRVTPKLVESLLMKAARGAAMTQGVALPPIKHPEANFARLQAFCGDAEVAPIHPFTLTTRIAQRDTVTEGLYVFDPGALGPHCGPVKLVLYSEKTLERGDPRAVEPPLVQKIWQDFAAYRER